MWVERVDDLRNAFPHSLQLYPLPPFSILVLGLVNSSKLPILEICEHVPEISLIGKQVLIEFASIHGLVCCSLVLDAKELRIDENWHEFWAVDAVWSYIEADEYFPTLGENGGDNACDCSPKLDPENRSCLLLSTRLCKCMPCWLLFGEITLLFNIDALGSFDWMPALANDWLRDLCARENCWAMLFCNCNIKAKFCAGWEECCNKEVADKFQGLFWSRVLGYWYGVLMLGNAGVGFCRMSGLLGAVTHAEMQTIITWKVFHLDN